MATKILAICGSVRTGSYNRQFLDVAVERLKAKGVEVEIFDLKANPIPLYDGDLEASEGLPETVQTLQSAIREADGVLFASPEYNASVTPLTKTIVDWASRGTNAWQGKVVTILSASPGALGGNRGVTILRASFVNCLALVPAEHCSLAVAHEAYDEAGNIRDKRTSGMLDATLDRLVDLAERLKG